MKVFFEKTENTVCTEFYIVSFRILNQIYLTQNEVQLSIVQFYRATSTLRNVLFTYLFYCYLRLMTLFSENSVFLKIRDFQKYRFTRKKAFGGNLQRFNYARFRLSE